MAEIKENLKKLFVNNRTELIMILVLIFLSAFLRLYRIREFLIFLGDEGRDALIVKRMIIDHKFTLLGPTASVGGFYLGPVYYYFMLPFLWFFHFDPVGPAVMVALFGVATTILLFLTIRQWTANLPAFFASLLYASAPGIVNFSRSSWNPNIMPFFSLLSIFSLYQAITRNINIWFIAAGIAYGIAIQSHYLGLVIGPILAVATLTALPLRKWLAAALLQLSGFLIGGSMFFIFEIRHGFPNIKSILEFVTRGGDATGPRSLNLIWLFNEMFRRNLEAVLPNLKEFTNLTGILLLGIFFVYLLHQIKNKKKLSLAIKLCLVWFFVGLLGVGSYKGQLYPHYFGYLFPLPFVITGFIFDWLNRFRYSRNIVYLLIFLLFIYNLASLSIWKKGSNLLVQTEGVTKKIIELSKGQPFNFALISMGNSDHAYRYLLEINGFKPLTLEEKVTEQLIVACEDYDHPCLPLGNPLWEIAGFGRAQIIESTVVEPGIQLVRLVHHPDSVDLIGKPAPKG